MILDLCSHSLEYTSLCRIHFNKHSICSKPCGCKSSLLLAVNVLYGSSKYPQHASFGAGLISSCLHQSWNTPKLWNMAAGAFGVITLALARTPKHQCINYYCQETGLKRLLLGKKWSVCVWGGSGDCSSNKHLQWQNWTKLDRDLVPVFSIWVGEGIIEYSSICKWPDKPQPTLFIHVATWKLRHHWGTEAEARAMLRLPWHCLFFQNTIANWLSAFLGWEPSPILQTCWFGRSMLQLASSLLCVRKCTSERWRWFVC